MITKYHAKYYAHELTKQGGKGVDRLSRSLFDACVDLNPHQIEAALFAIRSPISKGVMLADEVGLGKTIEAGLVICQKWAEGSRKILVISPASLRKQWAVELDEKFHLPVQVMDAKAYLQSVKAGNLNPFLDEQIIVCSMHYSARKAEDIKAVAWDLVVIDEGHKLRNCYRQSNQIGQTLLWALEDRKKIILTATPLQNSLLELYGLATLIDERIFGDLASFRTLYTTVGSDLEDLRDRLQSFSTRTLRRQVLEYIPFTERRLVTCPFKPTEREQKLYESISAFLQKKDSYSVPAQQRHLITLLVRKVLASSPQAVAGTLEMMHKRLVRLRDETLERRDPMEKWLADEDIDEDLLDELLEDQEDSDGQMEIDTYAESEEPQIDIERLNAEIDELGQYIRWARSIGIDTKTRSLLQALQVGFSRMEQMQAQRKAVIFTESKRTQVYLKDFLESNGYAGDVVTFNGSNSDPASISIYNTWRQSHSEDEWTTRSKAVNIRTALIEHFKNNASIMIATEAGAEGINLQFCSLVVNFDLPWNPQRIEQRIGRCHRYGQEHDVVVINFLNEKNEADRRVYELLDKKFSLFSGVFGASDEVLGTLESGVDFERKVLDICQQCRTREEISDAFAQLQKELDEKIQVRMQDTRKMLLEHFDEDVHSRLKGNLQGTRAYLDRITRMFWALSCYILAQYARFNHTELEFDLHTQPVPYVRPGLYKLISKEKNGSSSDGKYLYRLGHPLGEYVTSCAKNYDLACGHVVFNITDHPTKISLVEKLKGRSGYLTLQKLRIESFEKEDYLLFSAHDESGNNLDQETCEKLFSCKAEVIAENIPLDGARERLFADAQRHGQATISRSLEQNNRHFNEAREQLFRWAEDMEVAAQKELDDTKNQLRAANRQTRLAETVKQQHEFQEQIKALERKKRRLRQKLFDIEDQIAEKRDRLIDGLEKRMQQKTETEQLFSIRWTVR